MKLRTLITMAAVLTLFVSVAPVSAAVPTVNAFTVPATATSPVPVSTFTASDSDGTVVGYMITQTSTKPAATDPRWTATPWSSFTTTSIGALTLYAWAKDNASGVSNSKTATTNVVGTHVHTMAQVTGLTAALAGKANVTHNHDAVYQKKYANVVVVAKSGGDFTDIAPAVYSIQDASETNPYLIQIMPGVYDLSVGNPNPGRIFITQDRIDFQGSGEGSTILRSQSCLEGAIVLWASSQLRSLTVECSSNGSRAYGITAAAGAGKTVKLKHVSVTVQSPSSTGIIVDAGTNLVADDITVDSKGVNDGGASALHSLFAGNVTIANSRFRAEGSTAYGVTTSLQAIFALPAVKELVLAPRPGTACMNPAIPA